ncbi:CFEM domain-containing protein [Stagonosporopsis vannaccii]|nr:CFEM domain-containing protein [Stagonosporopsis vannaccii]
MKVNIQKLLILLLGLCTTTLAQSQMPACAQSCLESAFKTNTCTTTDKACICTNLVFQGNVTACVAATCTIPESLLTRNISLTNCGAPVRNHGQDYVVLSNIMIIVTAAFVVIRFTFKATVSRMDFGYDDWCVLVTLFSAVPSAIVTVYGTVKNGLGQDIWALTPQQITEMLKWFYVMASLYFTQVTLLKLSLIFFYIRVFPSKDVQRLLWGTVIFVVLWGLAFIITAIFQCQPIHYFWTKWDGLHEGKCLDTNAIAASNAAISIALDFWILGIPLWQLWGLKLHWKKKVAVALMFCLGTFVTIVSILRLQSLVHFAQSSNASWEFYDVSVWSTIEICVGIMCACLPTLRLLLVKLFPILGGSSARSRTKYYNYGSGNELKNIGGHSHSKRSHHVDTAISSPRSGIFEQGDGITVKTSYTVQHGQSDTDEASLVSHKEKGRH